MGGYQRSSREPWGRCAALRAASTRAGCACRRSSSGRLRSSPASPVSQPARWTSFPRSPRLSGSLRRWRYPPRTASACATYSAGRSASDPEADPVPTHVGRSALIDNDYKFVRHEAASSRAASFTTSSHDPAESEDLSELKPQLAAALRAKLDAWSESVDASVAGRDYAEGWWSQGIPLLDSGRRSMPTAPYFDAWSKRPEYRGRLKK